MENKKGNKPDELRSMEEKTLRLEKGLKEARNKENQYRHLFEKSPILNYFTDKQGCFLNVNQAGVRMMGYSSAKEIIGKKFQDFFFKDLNDFEAYEQVMQKNGKVIEFKTQMKQKNGHILSVNLTGAMRETISSKVKGYEGFATDISDRVEAEKLLKKSQGKYRSILDNSLAAIYMFQEGGYLSFVNKKFISLLGYENENEILERRFWEFVAPDDRENVRKRGLEREKEKTSPRQYSFRMIKKDGSIIWVDMRSSHAPYMGIPAVVGNFIDISREKKAKKEIQMLSRKLIKGIEEERRSLASDLHDEFGQALTLLQFDMESLQEAITEGLDSTDLECNKMKEQIQKLAEKIRNTTSRLRPDLLDHLGLVPTLEWYIEDCNNRVKNITIDFQAIGFKRRLSPDLEIVIYRIFQEGLNNITKHSQADSVDIKLTSSYPKVIFMMQDNGVGFDQKENGMPLEGLFKGIGLLSMKERVASLNGTIKIKSVFNMGTTIRVELPLG